MPLLVLHSVTKRYSSARHEHIALNEVSLDIEPGELVAVWGVRRSGRSTLLRVAAGIEPPDEGLVTFAGRELGSRGGGALGRGIGYCSSHFVPSQGGTVGDHVGVGLLADGTSRSRARARAESALERVGALHCADVQPRLLDPHEATQVAIARALVSRPSLLLVDEPGSGVDPLQREKIMQLITSIAADGVAVLMTVDQAVTHADRVLSIDRGELRGDVTPAQAEVVSLRSRRVERTA